MSDTLYGITHLFFHSNSTQKSIYCSTNNFKHLVQSTHLFLSLPPVKPCRNPTFFIVPTITRRSIPSTHPLLSLPPVKPCRNPTFL